MDKNESLRLQAAGKDAWNAWSRSMIARRLELAAAGQWAWARDARGDPFATSKAMDAWWKDAVAQFSYHEFVSTPDFDGFVFPGPGLFVGAAFAQGASFRATTFNDGACFNFGRFDGPVAFEGATFCSTGGFISTRFHDEVRFDDCAFLHAGWEPSGTGVLDCSEASFHGPARFRRMHCCRAIFSGTRFEQIANFDEACFDEIFFVDDACFRGSVRVRGAHFPALVDWARAALAQPVEA